VTQIVYRYYRMGDVVSAALQQLRSNSPVGSSGDPHPGLYRDSHTIFVDGHVVKDLSGWKPGSQINISNPVPYARKIEVGKMKLSVPNHVYEMAAQVLAGRFGNIAVIKFTFMPVRFGDIQTYAAFSKQLKAGRRRMSEKARQDWLVRQPSLQITAR
jgi:hypothetical protein